MFRKFVLTLGAATMLANNSQPASASGNAELAPGTDLAMKAQSTSSIAVSSLNLRSDRPSHHERASSTKAAEHGRIQSQ
jgi:hypothetical protein